MHVAVLAGILILLGLIAGWVLHHRSARAVMPVLTRLAAERNGRVESRSPFLMPTLRFSHSGTEAEVSSASTGIDGESTPYTYVLFTGLDWKDFEFRILPRSLQTIGDTWLGLQKPLSTGMGKLDKRLAIYTNNERLMDSVLSDGIRADLMSWAERARRNWVNDIRNYDNKLIYAVTGTLKDYETLAQLVDTACRFYDVVTSSVSDPSQSGNHIQPS